MSSKLGTLESKEEEENSSSDDATSIQSFDDTMSFGGSSRSISVLKGGDNNLLLRVSSNDPSLTKLKCEALGDAGVAGLSDALRQNSNLKILDVGRNDITAIGATSLAGALEREKSDGESGENPSGLETLWFRGNAVGDEGVSAIARALGMRENALERLSLAENEIKEAGARNLSLSLKENSSLKQLWLYGNYLHDNGAWHIGDALAVNTTLREIYLGENSIGDLGAHRIGRILVYNRSLKKLELSKNRITNDGARSLAKGLKKNEGLAELIVRKNEIGRKGCGQLIQVLTKNRTVTLLDIRDNMYEKEDAVLLKEQISQLKSSCVVLVKRRSRTSAKSKSGQSSRDNIKKWRKSLFGKKTDTSDADSALSTVPEEVSVGDSEGKSNLFFWNRIGRKLLGVVIVAVVLVGIMIGVALKLNHQSAETVSVDSQAANIRGKKVESTEKSGVEEEMKEKCSPKEDILEWDEWKRCFTIFAFGLTSSVVICVCIASASLLRPDQFSLTLRYKACYEFCEAALCCFSASGAVKSCGAAGVEWCIGYVKHCSTMQPTQEQPYWK